MSRVAFDLITDIKPPVPMADQRAARRKALLGEQQQELTIEGIRQELETAKSAVQKQAAVSKILAGPETPEQKYQALLPIDREAAESFLQSMDRKQLMAKRQFDMTQGTPGEELFAGATLSATPGGVRPGTPKAGQDVLAGTVEADIPEGQIDPVEVPHAPVEIPTMTGTPVRVQPQTARQLSQMTAKEALAKMEESSRLARETQRIAREDAARLQQENMRVAAELRPPAQQPQGAAVVQEYNFYADQEKAAGRTPLSFDQYQARDANRRAVRPPAPVVINTGAGPQLLDRGTGQASPITSGGETVGPAPTADMRNKAEARSRVGTSIKAVEDLSKKVITETASIVQRAKATGMAIDAALSDHPEYKTYQASRMALAGNLAVAQQGSRPSDADIRSIWLPLVPDVFSDTAGSAKMKWDMIHTQSGTNTAQAPPAGKIRVRRKSDGQTGTVDAADFDAAKYEKL